MNLLLAAASAAQESASHVVQSNVPGWLQLVLSGLLSLASGFIGGWVVAYHLGGFREKVTSWLNKHDEDIERINERLGSGKTKLDHVPTIQVKLEALMDTIKEVKDELQYQRENYVHVRECHKHREDEDAQ